MKEFRNDIEFRNLEEFDRYMAVEKRVFTTVLLIIGFIGILLILI